VSGRWVYQAPEAHVCDTGGVYAAGLGSIYECDCGIWWILSRGEFSRCWRVMSPRQIRRHKKLGGTV
jgi:hypothetical protein